MFQGYHNANLTVHIGKSKSFKLISNLKTPKCIFYCIVLINSSYFGKLHNRMNTQGEPRLPENEDIRELLSQFEKLRSGKGVAYISEESFERIIDHFDDQDSIPSALEAADMGILQFPYSSTLLVKKADLLIATRHYKKALSIRQKSLIKTT